jgi:hypothetical protein
MSSWMGVYVMSECVGDEWMCVYVCVLRKWMDGCMIEWVDDGQVMTSVCVVSEWKGVGERVNECGGWVSASTNKFLKQM